VFRNFLEKRWKVYGAILLSLGAYLIFQSYADAATGNLIVQTNTVSNSNLQIEAQETIVKKPILVAQSSKTIAALNVRISSLEEQVRALRGQVDGLQFQLSQMQVLMERQQEDYEFRFQQLEGGDLKKTEAVSQSGGVTHASEKSQNQTKILADGLELAIPGQALGSEPLTLAPANLVHESARLVSKEDADAQYRAGYDAVMRSDYTFAEEQFRQFTGLFPTHPQAPDAVNWLGETLIYRGAYSEAAEVLLNGFQAYSGSSRAPDILLKLGIALAGAGEKDTACRTFNQVLVRYPNVSNALKQKLVIEKQKAQC